MQKMAIFQRFSRTLLGNSTPAKAMNAFPFGGGNIMTKADNGMGIFNGTVEPVCNTIKNIAAQQGSYLSDFKKNPQGLLLFRGEGCFNTLRYNHSGIFAPLRVEQAAAPLPGVARFYSREKRPTKMPDRNRNIRDHKRRLLAAKYEVRRKLYKAFCRDPELPMAVRMEYRAKLSALPRNSSFVRTRNRCIFSGRSRAILTKFRLSRIWFRKLANEGEIMGVKKASW